MSTVVELIRGKCRGSSKIEDSVVGENENCDGASRDLHQCEFRYFVARPINIAPLTAYGLGAARLVSLVRKHEGGQYYYHRILTRQANNTMASSTGTGWAQLRQQARTLETQVRFSIAPPSLCTDHSPDRVAVPYLLPIRLCSEHSSNPVGR